MSIDAEQDVKTERVKIVASKRIVSVNILLFFIAVTFLRLGS